MANQIGRKASGFPALDAMLAKTPSERLAGLQSIYI
jgi:hypothetical protein